MNLDERLMTLLAGSPMPLPGCTSVWAGTARQRSAYGYVVFFEVSGAPIVTHDLQREATADRTRTRLYQFECRHTTRLLARRMAAELVEILTRYRDVASPGVQRCVPKAAAREGWEEADRVYRFDVDFEIMENFPEA